MGYTGLSVLLPNDGSMAVTGDNLHLGYLSFCLPYFMQGAAEELVKEADHPQLGRVGKAMQNYQFLFL